MALLKLLHAEMQPLNQGKHSLADSVLGWKKNPWIKHTFAWLIQQLQVCIHSLLCIVHTAQATTGNYPVNCHADNTLHSGRLWDWKQSAGGPDTAVHCRQCDSHWVEVVRASHPGGNCVIFNRLTSSDIERLFAISESGIGGQADSLPPSVPIHNRTGKPLTRTW